MEVRIIKSTNHDEISVLFSGGSDSTLAAALMCEEFERVHLLTYYHAGIPYAERSRINAKRLAKRFGEHKIRHRLVNFENLFRSIFYKTYWQDIKKYRGYITPGLCNACQIAMHTCTILYNIKNRIHFVCDGSKHEKSHLYIFTTNDGIKELRKLYREYSMVFKTPVYNIIRTDWKLFEMGLTPKKNVKFPHERVNYSSQHYCQNGIIVNAYLMGYFFPLYGQERSQRIALKYWKEKIAVAKNYINDIVKKNHLSIIQPNKVKEV